MELTYASLSSPGPAREFNADFLGFWETERRPEQGGRRALLALADSGYAGTADEPDRRAVDAALALFKESSEASTPQLVGRMFEAAHDALRTLTGEREEEREAGTSLSLVALERDGIFFGNVGSTRIYLLRQGNLTRLSTDDTYLAMREKMGLSGPDETDPVARRATRLTRALGREAAVRVDAERIAAQAGDLLLLCSDGLYGWVGDAEIADCVTQLSPARACRQLVALAESRGTDDCLSIQLVKIGELGEVAAGGESGPEQQLRRPAGGYDLHPGDTLDERFLLTEVIAESGMATLYKGIDLVTRQEVAVKVPFLHLESSPAFYSRFVREGEIGASLDHPYLLKFVEVEHKSRPYHVMEYLKGQTLAQLLKGVRRLPEKDALAIAARVCDALTYMHEQEIIHRDLKPQNVMMCQDGTIRIFDFGIAKSIGRRFTFAGFTPNVGTPEYMAPEQVLGKRGDRRTDVYSLGVMLYEMLVGERPFVDPRGDVFAAMNARVTGDPPAPRKVRSGISEQAEEIVLHAMERDPKKRHPSASALREELEHPEQVALTGRWQRLKTPSKWRRYWKSGLLLTVTLSAVLYGLIRLVLLILHRGP